MISTDIALFIKELLASILAYIPLVCFTGFFKAWIADKLGDNTARRLGYMTLNPMVHVDPIGTALLLLIHIGFGRRVPVTIDAIKKPFRSLKIVLLLAADFIGNFIALLIAISMLIACEWLMQLYGNQIGSTVGSVITVGVALMELSISLGVIGLVFGFFSYLTSWWTPAEEFIEEHSDFIMVLLALAVTVLIGQQLADWILHLALVVLSLGADVTQWFLTFVH
ncbi:hypothetical protein M1466_00535 [Candidatus Dependentiae bacterium]|nr:hypothetical protein [Candidatus Dependentiae bacterium]